MNCNVKQDPSGTWYVRLYLGRDINGKPVRKYKSFPDAKSESDAQYLAAEWMQHITVTGLETASACICDLLSDYVDMKEGAGASPNSIRQYRSFINLVARYIGNVNARSLTVMDFNRFEQRLGKPKSVGGQGLSRNSIIAVHNFIRGAYRFFIQNGICEMNPLIDTVRIRPDHKESIVLSKEEVNRLDGYLEEHALQETEDAQSFKENMRAFAAWLALHTGARVGEVCAIRLMDIGQLTNTIRINGTVIEEAKRAPYKRPITKGGKNGSVTITDEEMDIVRRYIALRERVCCALTPESPIISIDGSFVRPTAVSRAFKAIAADCEMPKTMTFHGLRHTHATVLLTGGIDARNVANRLRQADASTTLRNYAHVMPGMDAYVASAFSESIKKEN